MSGKNRHPMMLLAVQEMSIPQLTGVETLLQQQGRRSNEGPPSGSENNASSKTGDLNWLFESIDD